MNPPGATRKTLSDPQDHSQNPSPQKKLRKRLFGNQTGLDGNIPRATGDLDTSTTSQEVAQPELETPLPSFPGAEGTSSTAHGAAQPEPGLPGRQDAETLSAGVLDWENAPVRLNRSFRIVDIERLVGWDKPAGVSVNDAVFKNVWRIQVQDQNNPQSPVLEVYGPSINAYTATKMLRSHDLTAGPVDTGTFQSEAEARELGDCVCRLLDRFPYFLDAKKWHHLLRAKQSWVMERRLVQSRAIDICRPGFDRMQLAVPYREVDMSITSGELEHRPQSDRVFMRAVRCFFNDIAHKPYRDKFTATTGHRSSQIAIFVDVDDLDPDKVNALPDVPTQFPYKMVRLPKEAGLDVHNFSESEEALVLKAFQILQYRLAFKVGSRPALLEFSQQQYRKMLTSAALEKYPDVEEDLASVKPKYARRYKTLTHGQMLLSRIKHSVAWLRAKEVDVEGSTNELCRSVAASFITDVEAAEFRDVYSDRIRTEPPAVYTAEDNRLPQATQASLDAVYPFIFVNGRAAVHAPTNLVCTTLSTNYMKYIWAPCIIPAMRAAAEQTLTERDGGARNIHWWAGWNACMDRIHHLCRLIPYEQEKRLALTTDQVDGDVLSDYMECLRSSSWTDGQVSPVKGRRLAPLSTAGSRLSDNAIQRGASAKGKYSLRASRKKNAELAATKPKPPIWLMWTAEERTQIAQVMKEIEDDPRANPARLTMPRGEDGAPWPFREDHMPSDDVDLWDWLFREMIARYWRMWWECNFLHTTYESPMTLLLEVIVQWFAKKGGVDEFIHCEMTVYQKHPLRFSFGRSSKVEAGSPMVTGFMDPSPTSFQTQYDGQRSTIVVQPFIINYMWGDFNTSEHLTIFNTLLTLAPETAYYGRYQGSGYAPRYVMKPRRKSTAEDAQSESDEDEDDEDDQYEGIDKTSPLWFEYAKVNDFLDDYHRDTKKVWKLDRALLSAVRTADPVAFEHIRSEIYICVKATCCICGKRIVDGNILRCAEVDHEQALFHKECAPQSIGTGSSALCPTCESQQAMDLDYACDICGEKFADDTSLSAHNLTAHLPFAQSPGPEADTDLEITDAYTVSEDLPTIQLPESTTPATGTDAHVPGAPPVPEVPPTTRHLPESSTSAADLLEQRLLKLEQQQAEMQEQQRSMNEQQKAMKEQQAKMNEQQSKMEERQAAINGQKRELANRELDMLAREKQQLQNWQGMIAQRLEENEARERELRVILDI